MISLKIRYYPFGKQIKPQDAEEDPIFKTLTQKADGFLLIYSVTDAEGFYATSTFLQLIRDARNHMDTPLVFAGHGIPLISQLNDHNFKNMGRRNKLHMYVLHPLEMYKRIILNAISKWVNVFTDDLIKLKEIGKQITPESLVTS